MVMGNIKKRQCQFCDCEFSTVFNLRDHHKRFHPDEPIPVLKRSVRVTPYQPRQRKHRKMESPRRTIHLGDNVFVQKMLDGFLIKQSLSPSTSRTVLSLGSLEFKRLLIFSDAILAMLKKRPEKAKSLAEYETLLQNQTKFLLGKSVYVKISHLEVESLVHFTNYVMLNSMAVRGDSVVCPERFLLGLNGKQFEELLKIGHKTRQTECVPSDSTKSTSTHMESYYTLPPKKRRGFMKPSCETNTEKSTEQKTQNIPVLISNRDSK